MNQSSPRRNWVGPLFWYELIRLLRRGQHTRLRIALAILLLFTLFLVYANWFNQYDPIQIAFRLDSMMSSRSMAQFAESFVLAFMLIQLGFVVLITPIYIAGSITEEIHRRTLEALFTTNLTDSEIILGKLLARMLYVFGLLMTSIPILVLTLLWGGVDGEILLVSYAVILGTSISLAGLSIYKAIASGEIQTTLFQVYWLFLMLSLLGLLTNSISPFLGFPSPFVFLIRLFQSSSGDSLLQMGLVFFLVHLAFAILFIRLSMSLFRQRKWYPEDEEDYRVFTIPQTELIPPSPPETRPKPILPIQALREEVDIHLPKVGSAFLRPIERPRIDEEEPLIWKERYIRTATFWEKNEGAMSCLTAIWFFFVGLFLLLSLFSLLALLGGDGRGFREVNNLLVRNLGFLFLCGWIFTTGIQAVDSVTKERDRDTLVNLLLIPGQRKEILWAKWYACWSRGKIFPTFLIGLLVIGVFFGGICGLYAPLSFGYCIVMVAMSISLGLLLSVRCRSGFRAAIYFILLWLVILILPYFLAELIPAIVRSYSSNPRAELALYEFCRGLSPIQVWQTLNLPLYPPPYRGEELVPDRKLIPWVGGAAASTILAMMFAWIFWKWACWQFEREGRR